MEQENEKKRLQEDADLTDAQDQINAMGMSGDDAVEDVDISAELKKLGEQGYESGRRIVKEVKRRAIKKGSEISEEMEEQGRALSEKAQTVGTHVGNTILDKASHTLNHIEGETSVAVLRAKEEIKRAKERINKSDKLKDDQ